MLDEFPEFHQHVLEALRQPLEDGAVVISRAAGSVTFPAQCQLVAASNPCRRGCRTVEACVCSPAERARYLGRLSRPLLDRIGVARTIADLAGREGIGVEDLAEAIQYRSLDRWVEGAS